MFMVRAVIMLEALREFTMVHAMSAARRQPPGGRRPLDQACNWPISVKIWPLSFR